MHRMLRSFLFIGLLQSIYSAAVNVDRTCKSDLECPENYYCYEVSHMCAECKQNFCSLINRLNSYLKCHKEYSDCGPCLPGFEEEILTDGSPRAPCIRSNSLPLTREPEDIGPSNFTITSIIGFLSALLVFVAVGFFVYIKKKSQIPRENDCSQSEEAIPLNDLHPRKNEHHKYPPFECASTAEVTLDDRPPPFNPSAPKFNEIETKTLPPNTILNVEVNVHRANGRTNVSDNKKNIENSSLKEKYESPKIPVLNIAEDQRIKATENQVQAAKFKDADYENEGFKYEIAEESIPANEPVNETEESDFDAVYHNEETQESTWRPQTSDSTGEGASCNKTDEAPPKKIKLELVTTDGDHESDLVSRPFKHFSREKEE